jgi:hypothetical protein
MKAALVALALLASVPAGTASAAVVVSSSADFTVIGSVPKLCTISQPTLQASGLINFTNLSGNALVIAQLANPVTLSSQAATAKIDFDAVCTFPHTVTIESQHNGLWRDGSFVPPTGAGGMANAVPWAGRLIWGPVNSTFQFNAQNRQIQDVRFPVGEPFAGQLELDISILAGSTNNLTNAPLMSGNYRDIIYVTLTPQ